MRVALLLPSCASLVFFAPCGKEPKPIEEASASASSSPSPSTSASTSPVSAPEPPYGPAVFHPESCPPNDGGTRHLVDDFPSATNHVAEGCKSCKPGEFCQVFHSHGQAFGNCRRSDCQKDADCKGGLCVCGPPNLCQAGNCRSAADCGGRECVPDRWRSGHGHGQFCRTKDDTCKAHQDCGPGRECAYIGGKWDCRKETPPPPPG